MKERNGGRDPKSHYAFPLAPRDHLGTFFLTQLVRASIMAAGASPLSHCWGDPKPPRERGERKADLNDDEDRG